MRDNRSPSGSFIDMRSSSPARLHEAGDQTLRPEFTQRNAAHLELAVIGARTARHLAAIAHAILRRIARQLGELQRRGKTLLHRHGLVARDLFEFRATARKALGHPCPSLVLLD